MRHVLTIDDSMSFLFLRFAQLGRLSEAALTLDTGLSAVTGPPPAYDEPPPSFDKDRADSIESLRDELHKVRGVISTLPFTFDPLWKILLAIMR